MATTTKLKTTLRPLHDRVLIKRLGVGSAKEIEDVGDEPTRFES